MQKLGWDSHAALRRTGQLSSGSHVYQGMATTQLRLQPCK